MRPQYYTGATRVARYPAPTNLAGQQSVRLRAEHWAIGAMASIVVHAAVLWFALNRPVGPLTVTIPDTAVVADRFDTILAPVAVAIGARQAPLAEAGIVPSSAARPAAEGPADASLRRPEPAPAIALFRSATSPPQGQPLPSRSTLATAGPLALATERSPIAAPREARLLAPSPVEANAQPPTDLLPAEAAPALAPTGPPTLLQRGAGVALAARIDDPAVLSRTFALLPRLAPNGAELAAGRPAAPTLSALLQRGAAPENQTAALLAPVPEAKTAAARVSPAALPTAAAETQPHETAAPLARLAETPAAASLSAALPSHAALGNAAEASRTAVEPGLAAPAPDAHAAIASNVAALGSAIDEREAAPAPRAASLTFGEAPPSLRATADRPSPAPAVAAAPAAPPEPAKGALQGTLAKATADPVDAASGSPPSPPPATALARAADRRLDAAAAAQAGARVALAPPVPQASATAGNAPALPAGPVAAPAPAPAADTPEPPRASAPTHVGTETVRLATAAPAPQPAAPARQLAAANFSRDATVALAAAADARPSTAPSPTLQAANLSAPGASAALAAPAASAKPAAAAPAEVAPARGRDNAVAPAAPIESRTAALSPTVQLPSPPTAGPDAAPPAPVASAATAAPAIASPAGRATADAAALGAERTGSITLPRASEAAATSLRSAGAVDLLLPGADLAARSPGVALLRIEAAAGFASAAPLRDASPAVGSLLSQPAAPASVLALGLGPIVTALDAEPTVALAADLLAAGTDTAEFQAVLVAEDETAIAGAPSISATDPAVSRARLLAAGYRANVIAQIQRRAAGYARRPQPRASILSVVVGRSGQLVGRSVVRSSGSALADRRALDLVRRAAPFRPLPRGIGQSTIAVRIAVSFSGRR